MTRSYLCRRAMVLGTTALLFATPASAQQAPPGCYWKKYLYAEDAVQQYFR
jgi:hypothetical protein